MRMGLDGYGCARIPCASNAAASATIHFIDLRSLVNVVQNAINSGFHLPFR